MKDKASFKTVDLLFFLTLLLALVSAGCAFTGSSGALAGGSAPPPGSGGSPSASSGLSAHPAQVDFGNVVDGSSASQQVLLTNSGQRTITLSRIKTSGAAFAASSVLLPTTLQAGQSSVIDVVFAPQVPSQQKGTLAVVSSAQGSPATVALSGSGVPGPELPSRHSVSLQWGRSISTVTGYNVYRAKRSGGPYEKQNLGVIFGNSYTDSSVQSRKTYFYVVTAVDNKGRESTFSNEAVAQIP